MTDHLDNSNAAYGRATHLTNPEMTATHRQARRTTRNRAIAGASVGFAALGAALMMFAGTSSAPWQPKPPASPGSSRTLAAAPGAACRSDGHRRSSTPRSVTWSG